MHQESAERPQVEDLMRHQAWKDLMPLIVGLSCLGGEPKRQRCPTGR